MFRTIRNNWRQGRRGAVVVLVAVVSTIMVGFAALTIDAGTMYIARTELQTVADSSALAGASVYFTNAGLTHSDSDLTAGALQRSSAIGQLNRVQGKSMVIASSDLSLGQHDYSHPTAALLPGDPWNAVQVTARRVSGGTNGPVQLLFATIWGRNSANMAATARAVCDDRMGGYKLEDNTSGMGFMPITIPVDGFYDMLSSSGTDQYCYDGSVKTGTDGVHEVLMYPWKWKDGGGTGGSGNFGLLDMHRPNNGASALSYQISHGGASAADVQAQLHTSTLVFYDDTHTASTGPRTYSCSGTPGMKTTIESALSDQIGKVFGFFLNNGLSGNGTNATYSICGVFFARIVAVDISGGKNACGLIVQPVAYTDSWVTISATAPSSYNTAGRLSLVR